MLHVPAHEVNRAKFPVTDVHTHTNDGMGVGSRVDPAKFVEMVDHNIKTIVILTGPCGISCRAQRSEDEIITQGSNSDGLE